MRSGIDTGRTSDVPSETAAADEAGLEQAEDDDYDGENHEQVREAK
ncbi:MAG: hypothetical protein ACREMY_02780 [bacterium]